jgi:hypothetical protein
VTQAESGCAVTPATCTRPVFSSTNNRTLSVLSRTVSTVKKSQAMILQAWVFWNTDHVGVGVETPLRHAATPLYS